MKELEQTEQLMLQIVLGRLSLACIHNQNKYTRIYLTELQNSVIRGFNNYFLSVEKFCEEINARIDAIESDEKSNAFWAYDQIDNEEWAILPVVPGYFKQADHCITFMAPSREEAEIVVKEKIIPFLTAS